jgi:hypothetical protein
MSKFHELLNGDDDNERGGRDRSLLPYRQQKRELSRRKAELEGELELHLNKVDAVNKAMHHGLGSIQMVGPYAQDTARQGPMEAALTVGRASWYDMALNVLGSQFLGEIRDI